MRRLLTDTLDAENVVILLCTVMYMYMYRPTLHCSSENRRTQREWGRKGRKRGSAGATLNLTHAQTRPLTEEAREWGRGEKRRLDVGRENVVIRV